MAAINARTASGTAGLPAAHANSSPVLVELFTSEGCSSCPPADALLARLQRDQPIPGANILVLEEHVDYWDSLGWHDRFSSHQLTVRQGDYVQRLHLSDSYTPQMIVDGTSEFVGNDRAHALRVIGQAAHTAKLPISLAILSSDQSHLAGTASVTPASNPFPNADVYAALVQSMASTQVLRGENGGQTLHHVSIVRQMKRIGSLADASTASLKFSLDVPADTTPAGLRLVVFLQRASDGAILGATSCPASASPEHAAAAIAPGALQHKPPTDSPNP
ncbi:MAG TPA: DUF1223 domain-containing protein [Acidobacteriaceae bacterium]|jgi:hypothetical protein